MVWKVAYGGHPNGVVGLWVEAVDPHLQIRPRVEARRPVVPGSTHGHLIAQEYIFLFPIFISFNKREFYRLMFLNIEDENYGKIVQYAKIFLEYYST